MAPMTAEKEKVPLDDKVFIQAKTQQVLEELVKIDGFTELVQKGLKAMTHKHFIMILHHFLKPIVGHVLFDGTNYVDYVHNFLVSMDYPYTINKSSLKTPSAPHCHNSIIVLLAWLSEFSVNQNEAELLIEHGTSEDFDTPEISKMFMQKTAGAFILWNNQKEAESDDVMEQIRRMYIEKKIESGVDLDTELNRLKKSIDDLKRESKPANLQQIYNAKREESKQLSKQIDEHNKTTKDASKKLKSLQKTLEKTLQTQTNTERELKKSQNNLSHQKITQEEKKKLLMEITQSKQVLASKKESTMELWEAISQNEIQLSNLVQKKFQLIDKLNNFLYKLSSNLEIAGVLSDKFNPTLYEIKTNKTCDTAALNGELEQMSRGLIELKEKYLNAISTVNQSLLKLEAEKHQLVTITAMKIDEINSMQEMLTQINHEESTLENLMRENAQKKEEVFRQNAAELKRMTDGIEKLQQNIGQYQDYNSQITEQMAVFKAKSVEQCKAFYEKRKQEVELHRSKLSEMNKIVEEFRKRRRPFAENIQKTIDEVMNKREKKD